MEIFRIGENDLGVVKNKNDAGLLQPSHILLPAEISE